MTLSRGASSSSIWPGHGQRERRTRLFGAIAATLLAALVVGCGPDYDPPSKLSSLRILGIRAEPPEARPGELVTLDALTWMPGGGPSAPDAGEKPQPTFAWRACFLQTAMAGMFDGGGGMRGSSTERPPSSCFDLAHSTTLEELAGLFGAEDPAAGQETAMPDLSSLAIDLGTEPTASLPVLPLPPFPGPPSFCTNLSDELRAEQGGREMWIAGIRLMISLRIGAGGQTVTANKRLVLRPAVEQIPAEEQGMPFRAPRLCQEAEQNRRLCARNRNPPPPALSTPNGEWSGSGPIRVRAGEKIKLRPDPPGSEEQQPYVAMKQCGEQQVSEELRRSGGEYERLEARYYAWFSDGGEVLADSTVLGEKPGDRDSAWEAPEKVGSEQRYDLLLLTWDGRGGTSWSSFELVVEP